MVVFNNIIAIFRKELQGYFTSPLSYIITTVFWLMSGFFFWVLLLSPFGIIQDISAREQMGYPLPPIDVAYEFLRGFFDVMGSLVLFILPILSMGLYSEEKKQGTLELLATSPITNFSVAVGKLLGVLTFFITMILPFFIYEIIAFSTATPPIPFPVPILAHLALILLAASILSLGMFVSSLTSSSLISAILTFFVVLSLWLIDILSTNMSGFWGEVLNHISLLKNYTNLVKGIFDTSSIIVFLSYIILGIFLSIQSIETFKYQRD